MAARVLAAVALGIGIPASTASAEVIVKGTGEPAFTSSANNTQWVEWTNAGPYRVEFNHHVNGGAAVLDGPYAVPSTGSTSVNWTGIRGTSVPLQEGATYTICGFGRWQDATGMWWPDFSTSCGDADRRGLRASTTIDRTAPVISVALAGSRAATRAATLPLRVDFADNLAGPFPANFVCVQHGAIGASGPCAAADGHRYVEQPACSQPLAPGRTTAFECGIDAAAAPDGPVHVCVMAADASIPDNPTSADQRGASTTANRSAPQCDSVLLDRAAPTVAIEAPSAVRAGDLVTVAARASDATSGLSGAYTWRWGDGTAAGAGQVASHTFTAAGTYEVAVETADAAGNATVARAVITVAPRPQDGGGGAPADQPQPQPTPTPSPMPAPEPAEDIGEPEEDGVTLSVKAPRRLALGAAKGHLPLTLEADAPGVATVTLRRGARRLVQGAARLASGAPKSVRLRLPKRMAAGAHRLRVVFTAAGGDAVAVSRSVTFTGRRASASLARAGIAPATRVVDAGLGPVLPDGRYRGPAGRVARAR